MKQKRAHYGNALEYQNLQDRNPVEATEIQPYINKYGLQLLVHVRRGESHTQLQPNDFWIGTLSVIPINKVRVCGIVYRLFFCVEGSG